MMRPYPLAAALAATLTCAALPAAAQEHAQHDHAAHAAHAAAAVTTPAQRWATDAPLREGMARVRAALSDLSHHEMGHMSNEQAREFAVAIEDAVKFMFANCKLPAEPDAGLHAILVPLLAAAQRLDKDPADKTAVAAMRDAVAPYPRQFDDPAWPAAKPAAADHQH